jgi:hypothetical protein
MMWPRKRVAILRIALQDVSNEHGTQMRPGDNEVICRVDGQIWPCWIRRTAEKALTRAA